MQQTEPMKLKVNVLTIGNVATNAVAGFNVHEVEEQLKQQVEPYGSMNLHEAACDMEWNGLMNILIIDPKEFDGIEANNVAAKVNELLQAQVDTYKNWTFEKIMRRNFIILHLGIPVESVGIAVFHITSPWPRNGTMPKIHRPMMACNKNESTTIMSFYSASSKESISSIFQEAYNTLNGIVLQQPPASVHGGPQTEHKADCCVTFCCLAEMLDFGGKRQNIIAYSILASSVLMVALGLGLGLYSDELFGTPDPALDVLTNPLKECGIERWIIVLAASVVAAILVLLIMKWCTKDNNTAIEQV